MDFNYTWDALLKLAQARDYFYIRENIEPLDIRKKSFSLINAWWLSEISRLFYRKCSQEHSEIDRDETRARFLEQTGFKEIFFVNERNNQCALLESPERDFAVMVFRGSDSFDNWVTNFIFPATDWSFGGRVHRGFKACFERLDPYISKFLHSYKKMPMIFTGHSLGSALATLAASKYQPDQLYTFGSPRVGNPAFLETLSDISIFRIQNNLDLVTRVPFEQLGFKHAGELYYLNRENEDIKIKNPLMNPVSILGPPPFISDHAPINYSVHLSRQLQNEGFSA